MKRWFVSAALALSAVSLGACGFHPLYGSVGRSGHTSQALRSIAVDPINTKIGAQVRNNLIDRLTPEGSPATTRYNLKVKLSESVVGVGVRLDASVTRYNYQLVAQYRLIDQKTQQPIFSNSSRSLVAYDVVQSQFATIIARQNAQERAAESISEDITLRLALFFDDESRFAGQPDTEQDADVIGSDIEPAVVREGL